MEISREFSEIFRKAKTWKYKWTAASDMVKLLYENEYYTLLWMSGNGYYSQTRL